MTSRLMAMLVFLCLVPSVCPAPPTPSKVEFAALDEVEKVYPGSRGLVWAIRVHENGRTGHECGNHGRTEFARRYPRNQRNYLEAGRSVARFTLEYGVMKGKRPEFFDYLASRYYAGDETRQRAWARSVRYLYRQIERTGKLPDRFKN